MEWEGKWNKGERENEIIFYLNYAQRSKTDNVMYTMFLKGICRIKIRPTRHSVC